LAQGTHWAQVAEYRFAQPVHYASFNEFAKRMLYPTFADHGIDEVITQCVREAFEPHCTEQGPLFVQPMRVRLLQRTLDNHQKIHRLLKP
jgi:hypothetical protein